MQKIILLSLVTFVTLSFINNLSAQGCVAVRQMGGTNAMYSSDSSISSYNLNKGDLQVGANYRYFHSWRHFVGDIEQPQRQNTGGGIGADGIDHGNAVNIYSHALDLNFSYALSDRWQINATLPYVHNERSQVLKQTKPVVDTFRYSVFALGLGDVRFGINYWVFDPAKAKKGNLMLGVGIKLNTGDCKAEDIAPQTDGTKRYAIMDQAIQPGDGGVGYSVELQAFRKVYKGIFGFANGYYLFSPQTSNGTAKSAPTKGLEGYNVYACPDQYFARAGLMASVGNFTFSCAVRTEGIPVNDVFGSSIAYRRPGYVWAIEPGITYRNGNHTFNLYIPYNFYKNRTQSAADIAAQNLQNEGVTDPAKMVNIHGDAAFADYSISLGYAYRFVKAPEKPAQHGFKNWNDIQKNN